MKVLIIGSGGREHALAYLIAKSSLVDKIFWTPGNPGARNIAEIPHISADDISSLIAFVKKERIDLTVVGPEAPLVGGITDAFRESNLEIFGPTASGAQIEGSKSFAKELMAKKGIPTAGFKKYSDKGTALSAIKAGKPPWVIKANGLAAGKGVSIVQTEKEADKVLSDMFERKIFGRSGLSVIVEDFLEGEEATVLAICDGKNILPLLSSQDHKPVYDGDRGPNTGGMGAIAPAPVVSTRVMDRVIDKILMPLVEELISRGIDYRGIIYAGLMIKDEDPYVVEFNCRFGDPEAEAVFPLIKTDLCETILMALEGNLKNHTIRWKNGYACDVVLVSGGYPGSYDKGKPIMGIELLDGVEDLTVFHAGTRESGDVVVTSGGRVLNIVGTGPSLKKAIEHTYKHVEKITFEGMHFRKDIGFRGMKYFQNI
jgi:phosphoribosylamine--glycine ligase